MGQIFGNTGNNFLFTNLDHCCLIFMVIAVKFEIFLVLFWQWGMGFFYGGLLFLFVHFYSLNIYLFWCS